jgi:hypothetical protein
MSNWMFAGRLLSKYSKSKKPTYLNNAFNYAILKSQ